MYYNIYIYIYIIYIYIYIYIYIAAVVMFVQLKKCTLAATSGNDSSHYGLLSLSLKRFECLDYEESIR